MYKQFVLFARDIKLSQITKNFGLIFCFAFILFTIFQMVLYGRYAVEATAIYAREAMGIMHLSDQKKLGAICNSLGRVECSIRQFTKIIKLKPDDTESLSNLAISLAMNQQPDKAEPYFRAYFASGGDAIDVMYWYGRALIKIGHDDEAITWYYNILSHQMYNEDVALDLLALLKQKNRTTEAKSVIATLMLQADDSNKMQFWQSQLANFKESQAENVIFIPALDGRRFYLPVTTSDKKMRFIQSLEDQTQSQMSYSDALELGVDEKKIKSGRFTLAQMQIGPFTVKDVELTVCESCKSVIGSKLLSYLKATIDGRGRVPYLVLHKGE